MRFSIAVILFLFSFTSVHAQFTENFDTPAKGAYAPGTANLDSGTWYIAEGLIGNLDADQKFGSHSVRLGSALPDFGSRLQMQFDVQGAGQVSFYYGTYITDANAGRHSLIQLQQSIDGGFVWTNVESPVTTSTDFNKVTYDIDYPDNIRFRIVKLQGGTASSRNHRVNVDDFEVTEYIEPFANARASIRINTMEADLSSEISYRFPVTLQDANRSSSLLLVNTGQENLEGSAKIDGIDGNQQSVFILEGSSDFDLGFRESKEISIRLDTSVPGTFTGYLIIESNDVTNPRIIIELSATITGQQDVTPISVARELPFNTLVTVSGWVSTANEFGGPIFIQDETGGIAVFYDAIHTAVERGDSVVVTGPVSEFNPTGNNPGQFLRQITGSDVRFSVHPEGRRILTPRTITLSEMNAGCCESQLVLVEDVEFIVSGNFPTNTQNFTLRQNGVSAVIRIDTRSNFANAPIPDGATNIIGVVDRFNGTYQLKPRDTDDLGVEAFENPFAGVPKSETFDVATWNIEWFGDPSNGPSDRELQFRNVRRVIETMDMDLYALQEISNVDMFNRLVDSLEHYNGFLANYSQTQKVAYLYKTSVIDSLSSGFVAQGSTWANGRWPFQFEFDATVGTETRRITSINFHAKAFASQSDYDQRLRDATELKRHADTKRSERLIILGDFNDDVINSTWSNLVTPYEMFNADPDYTIVTRALSEMGFTSYRSVSMIDHIMINSQLFDEHLFGAEQIENTGYIGSYLTTTSDHYPVWTRFKFETSTSVGEYDQIPQSITLHQNYPNPFNPTTSIRFDLPSSEIVTLRVYDVTGRSVAVLANEQSYSAGQHQIDFDASSISSGLLIYTLQTSSGFNTTRKMMLIK